jgi:hypothetical protein
VSDGLFPFEVATFAVLGVVFLASSFTTLGWAFESFREPRRIFHPSFIQVGKISHRTRTQAAVPAKRT